MNEIIHRIMNMIPNVTLSESFIDSVLKRLISLGYKYNDGSDDFALCFAIQKVENHIKNSCNTISIPDGLHQIAVDMICGEFLFAKKQTGQLQIAELDLTSAITSISEGDTSVTFDAASTDEEKFNQLLNVLMTKGEGEFVCFRKLSW